MVWLKLSYLVLKQAHCNLHYVRAEVTEGCHFFSCSASILWLCSKRVQGIMLVSGIYKDEDSSLHWEVYLTFEWIQLMLMFCFFSASDAYCLLEVYEKLCKDPESFGLSSDLTESLVGKASVKPRAKKQLNKQEVPSPSGQVCKQLQRAACCSRPL